MLVRFRGRHRVTVARRRAGRGAILRDMRTSRTRSAMAAHKGRSPRVNLRGEAPPRCSENVIYRRVIDRPRGTKMSLGSDEARWEVELRSLREELRELRAEQREMAEAVRQLVQTFRTLAAHLGIAAEPYVKKGSDPSADRDLPGFA